MEKSLLKRVNMYTITEKYSNLRCAYDNGTNASGRRVGCGRKNQLRIREIDHMCASHLQKMHLTASSIVKKKIPIYNCLNL